jgi:recombination protein RecA
MNKDKPRKQKITRFRTGSTIMDLIVGGGQGLGYPWGKIVNIVGDKSSGKTFLACELIATAYYEYNSKFRWVYDDAESGFTFDTEELYGVEIMPRDETERTKSGTVEDWYCNLRNFLDSMKKGEAGIYVMDSLDGLSSDEIEEREKSRMSTYNSNKDFKKGSYQMGAAKFLSQEFFKTLTDMLTEKNVLLIIISQTREKIDSMFKGQHRSGGKALDFYAHTCLWLSTFTKIKKKDRAVGVVVKAHAKKSKTPRPFREGVFTLLFDYGIDNIGSNLDFLFGLRGDKGLLKDVAKKIVWSGSSKTISSVKAYLEEKGLLEEYREFAIEENGKKNVKLDTVNDFVEKKPELKEVFEKTFGIPVDRSTLIKTIEENGWEDELEQRTINKWEEIEAEIRSNRKAKYKT